jgi:hypothetical protein
LHRRSVADETASSCVEEPPADQRATGLEERSLKLGEAFETPVVSHLKISHSNEEKVRWALDDKGVAHARRAVTPAPQEFTARRLRARHGAGRGSEKLAGGPGIVSSRLLHPRREQA